MLHRIRTRQRPMAVVFGLLPGYGHFLHGPLADLRYWYPRIRYDRCNWGPAHHLRYSFLERRFRRLVLVKRSEFHSLINFLLITKRLNDWLLWINQSFLFSAFNYDIFQPSSPYSHLWSRFSRIFASFRKAAKANEAQLSL